MKTILAAALAGALALTGSIAEAQKNVRIRGTITAISGDTLSLKNREGKPMELALTEKTSVAAAKGIKLADLKPGAYVGSTTMKRADGALVAVEVHTIPRRVPEGHRKWDLQPGSMMTNANIASVVKSADGDVLTLDYKGGSQKILVPPSTPIVTTTKADRSYLKPGEYAFIVASVDEAGKTTALRIQVSKDGVKPPQ
jgi:hypothetical protein